jgi:hypothetical protein
MGDCKARGDHALLVAVATQRRDQAGRTVQAYGANSVRALAVWRDTSNAHAGVSIASPRSGESACCVVLRCFPADGWSSSATRSTPGWGALPAGLALAGLWSETWFR